MVVLTDPESPAAQTFRLLRGNVEHQLPGGKSKGAVLLITSGRRGDGKSTVAANLAVAFAEKQRSTLLIDLHLENPTIHSLLGTSLDPGLAQILQSPISLSSVLSRRNDPGSHLDVITAGAQAKNGSVVENRNRLQQSLLAVIRFYRFIVIDGPPLAAAKAAGLLMELSDLVLVVIDPRRALSREARQTLKDLRSFRRDYCCLVMNRTPLPHDWNVQSLPERS